MQGKNAFLQTGGDDFSQKVATIRAKAEANPQGRLSRFLAALEPKATFASGGIQGGPAGNSAPSNGTAKFDGYLLQWSNTVTDDERDRTCARIGYQLRQSFALTGRSSSEAGERLEVVDLPGSLPIELVAQALARQQGVRGLEPNWILQKQASSADPSLTNGELWGMYGSSTTPANSFGIDAINAWARDSNNSVTGNSANKVYVGVIDEGTQWSHPDLFGQIGNPFEIANDGVDNDRNGYVDDVYGWDFANNDNSVYDGGSLDSHGTHVSGTIGAKNNGSGVAGVAWNLGIINGKFLGALGGTTAGAILAIDYMTKLKQLGLDIVATNNSWGGGGFSSSLQSAIERANVEGILFIAAAGNDGIPTVSYPAGYTNSNIISVASITNTGARSSFSNYGASWVDLGAPGSGIRSTVPLDSYATWNGTSMATPHVTGAVAYLASWGKAKGLFSSAQDRAIKIRNAILQSATPTPSLNGITSTGGRLNLDAALKLLDPSLNLYTVSGTPNPVSEGATINLSITEQNASAGLTADVYWRLSGAGITASDLDNGLLTGSLAIGSNSLTLSFSNDLLTEGAEQALFELSRDSTFSVVESAYSISINDTSTSPQGAPIIGTVASDTLRGTTAPELIIGVPQTGTGTSMGLGQTDTVTGLAGADVFVIGDARGVLYNDGIANNVGAADHLRITDFQKGVDKIQINAGTSYFTRTTTINRVAVTELYWDRVTLGTLNLTGANRDELVARLTGTFSGTNALTISGDFVVVA